MKTQGCPRASKTKNLEFCRQSENTDEDDVSDKIVDLVEEGLEGLDWVSMRDDVAENLVGRLR